LWMCSGQVDRGLDDGEGSVAGHEQQSIGASYTFTSALPQRRSPRSAALWFIAF
jgi:hypothetical protein